MKVVNLSRRRRRRRRRREVEVVSIVMLSSMKAFGGEEGRGSHMCVLCVCLEMKCEIERPRVEECS